MWRLCDEGVWGDLALWVKARRLMPEQEVSKGRSSAGSVPKRHRRKRQGPNESK